MIRIRPERPDDATAIRRTTELAFGQPDEADLVDRLRPTAGYIGRVATLDRVVVGHIAFSQMTLSPTRPGLVVFGLAPMAVLPDRQREGIGSALVREGLDACQRAGADAVFVLGHPAYYPRFGFSPAADVGLASEYDVPREAFMVRECRVGALKHATGVACYHPAFAALG
ncbi:MAG: N-acetyltransferase [Rubricoccaceae bacterium]